MVRKEGLRKRQSKGENAEGIGALRTRGEGTRENLSKEKRLKSSIRG